MPRTASLPPSAASASTSSITTAGHGWRAWSLRVRIFLAGSLILTVMVIAVVLLQSHLSQREQLHRVKAYELPAQLREVAASVQAQLNLAIAGSEALANDTQIQAWAARGAPEEELPAIVPVLEQRQRSLGANAIFLAAVLPEGVRYFHYENQRLQTRQMLAEDPSNVWYFGFLERGGTFELNLDSNPLSPQLLMFVNYRSTAASSHRPPSAVRGEAPAIVAGGGMGVGQLAQLIARYKVGGSGQAMLVRADGMVDVHPDASQSGQLNLRELPGFASLMQDDWRQAREQLVVQEAVINGQPSYIAALYLPDLQRFIVAHLPEQEITSGIARNRSIALLAGGVLLVLGLVLLYPLSANLLRPLHQLRRQIEQLTQTLDLSMRMHTRDKAEIGDMSQQLNHFLQRLHQAFTGVNTAVQGIHQRTGSIAQGNHDLSGRTQSQAAALEQSSTGMQQLVSTVQQNAGSTHQASGLMGESARLANEGVNVMQQVQESMSGIAQSSEQIGLIVDVIDSIAFQTNILALNAAVEAARAGEQGRGFAVVASEVRALAQRSSEAARQIHQLIAQSGERVQAGTHSVQQAHQTMHSIVQAVQQVSGLIEDIAHASQEQAHGLGELSSATLQVQGLTQANADLVQDLASAASDLAQEGEHLHELMAAFRLGA
ncbi:MAG: HAMP domain-containing protein [Comamonas sp.]|nr:HAMP domain-containing protein [Comamonas sp.]